MERALYDPAHGYYTATATGRVGRGGDFITNVSVGPLFGKLIAAQAEEMWRQLGSPAQFTVVEQGADSGAFAADFLAAARAGWPGFAEALRYQIIEPFSQNRERQAARLAGEPVEWVPSVEALPAFTGLHFSNELLDAFPIHRVVFAEGRWHEQGVAWAGGRFVWQRLPLPPELEPLTAPLPQVEGYATELNPAAQAWVAAVAARLERGYMLVVDYGFSRADYYLPERRDGTLTGYRAHRRVDDVLEHPGEGDLTAHVEFTSLAEAALASGLGLAGFADQHRFMVAAGRRAFPDASAPLTPERQREMRAFASLMHPALMGRGFHYLAFAKDAPPKLHGFEYAGDAALALGLVG